MPLIKRRPKEVLKPMTFRLPQSLIEKLTAYAEFVNVPHAEIVAAAITHAIDTDKEFPTDCTHSAISTTTHSAANGSKQIAAAGPDRPEPDSRLKAVRA